MNFNLNAVHPSWQPCLQTALTKMDPSYLEKLAHHPTWLPGPERVFNAFSLPVSDVNYILLGESPYPRPQSANGYAFWDAAIEELWSSTGFSKKVNRATSMRNILKMLLIANKALTPSHTTQSDIALLNKSSFLQTNTQLFERLLHHGFLLLNASLVLQETPVKKDAIAWQPFIRHILQFLLKERPRAQFILFGKIANAVDHLLDIPPHKKLYAEHPYNISFIHNPAVLNFFAPLRLLDAN